MAENRFFTILNVYSSSLDFREITERTPLYKHYVAVSQWLQAKTNFIHYVDAHNLYYLYLDEVKNYYQYKEFYKSEQILTLTILRDLYDNGLETFQIGDRGTLTYDK